jgi:hypothetical protein
MTVCYAHEYPDDSVAAEVMPCRVCGHYVWEHSHDLAEGGGGPYRRLVTRHMAQYMYDLARHGLSKVPQAQLPPPDLRPRYQMMMDRQPTVTGWYDAVRRRAEIDAWMDAPSDADRERIIPGSTTIHPDPVPATGHYSIGGYQP